MTDFPTLSYTSTSEIATLSSWPETRLKMYPFPGERPLNEQLNRIIVLVHTHEVISTKSERKPLMPQIVNAQKLDFYSIFKPGKS